ncbi:response regulator transcription factor [Ferdinandcohnia quinoae]|uniref:Response regulator transcription factor n=1 Tax=Fredinandcohnia quinoae TaxID=2918902 RepID=A0AAW5E1H3_9BACI|nr:response regulator transcription factor [Fredinandcohnia sp. SECRCQ15]MCH1624589.1 response regulator transcription factor [Fredinandcohnia sp. SECRCQ15]
MKPIKIGIVDDHPIIRDGFKTILEIQDEFLILGTAKNGEEAIKLAESQPDVMLMDIQMPIMDGIEATKIIKKMNPTICILMLTSNSTGQEVIEAISSGASGFLLKDWETAKIIHSIKEALFGNFPFPWSTSSPSAKVKSISWNQLPFPLSSREREIATLLILGYKNEQIASELFLSVGTVKNYITGMYKKFGVKSRRSAILYLNKYI